MAISPPTQREALRLLILLILFQALLAIAYLADAFLHPSHRYLCSLIDLDSEISIPTWFSSMQLFAVAVALWMQTRHSVNSALPSRAFWYFGAAGFLFLSMDEAVTIHETITGVMRRTDWAPRFNDAHGIWIYVYGVVAVAILAAVRPQLQALWRRAPRAFLTMGAGALAFLLGAVGLEIWGYQMVRESLLYKLEVAAEEFLEMAGVSLILYGALNLSATATAEPASRMAGAQSMVTRWRPSVGH